MPNLNKVILAGHLTRNPELKYTPQGNACCRFAIAINRQYKNTKGELEKEVVFIDCVAWGKTGETIQKYLHKGDPILVEGRIHSGEYVDKEKNKRKTFDVIVESFHFLGTKGKDNPQQPYDGNNVPF